MLSIKGYNGWFLLAFKPLLGDIPPLFERIGRNDPWSPIKVISHCFHHMLRMGLCKPHISGDSRLKPSVDGTECPFHFVSDPADSHVHPLFPLGNLACPCAFMHDAAFQLHPGLSLFLFWGRIVPLVCKDRSRLG